MPIYVAPEEQDYVNKIAKRAGTFVAGDTNIVLIAFPILEKLIERVEKLEKEVNNA